MSEGKTIAIVEDSQDSLELLSLMIETLGHKVIPFKDGKSIVAQAENLEVDLVMLDVMMPEMDGYETLQELKKFDNFKDMNFIMVTAKTLDDDVMEGYKQGAVYYITKPYTIAQLNYALDLYLNK